MEELPDWPDGTVAILSTAAGAPHAIPVSTALRSGPRTIHLALARRRDSLRRLREDPHVALAIAAADVACTADGIAVVVEERLRELDRVAAVRIDVVAIHDHRAPRFRLDGGVAWRWTDPQAERDDAAVRAGLRRLAGR